jgi:general secretion pathway protein B
VASAPRPIALAQLSPDLRREMPAMSVGGSVYSPDPPSRFIIINGQVVREGEGAAAGVTVERIGPKSAVLRWREMRIEVPL